ncbi:hypothetical protein TNCV_2790661 [Trichonephila clavipes]|nr:hypothetical protein TNCV_2790661 [Trichonephila clavipes]
MVANSARTTHVKSRLPTWEVIWNVAIVTRVLKAFDWPPSDQHTVITGTKAELEFIRKHNTSLFPPPMSFSCHHWRRNGNGLESMEYTLQVTWFGADLEVIDF